MPDLGKYALNVLAAYGAAIVLVAGLIWATLWRAHRVKHLLHDVEERRKRGRDHG